MQSCFAIFAALEYKTTLFESWKWLKVLVLRAQEKLYGGHSGVSITTFFTAEEDAEEGTSGDPLSSWPSKPRGIILGDFSALNSASLFRS
jgi:hypothetical protein